MTEYYDPKSGRTGHESAERIVAFIDAHGLETHAHADHVGDTLFMRDGVRYLKIPVDAL